VSGFTDQRFGYADSSSLSPAGGYFSNASKTAFAWALMAGLDFDISTNLKLELGYRYLHYSSIPIGGLNCPGGKSGGTFNNVNCSGDVASYVSSHNTLASSDFRLGLIYAAREASTSPNVTRY
jgi:opacity protein-like surface antigen